MNVADEFRTTDGAPGSQRPDDQSLAASAQGDGGGPAPGNYHLEKSRITNQKRFTSLPHVRGSNKTSDVPEKSAKKKAKISDAGLISIDSTRTHAVLGESSKAWNSNFSMAKPKDHISINITKLIASTGSRGAEGARRAVSSYKPPPPYVEKEMQKL